MSWFSREAYNRYLQAQVQQATDPQVKSQLEVMLADSQRGAEFGYFQTLIAASRAQAELEERRKLAGETEDENDD